MRYDLLSPRKKKDGGTHWQPVGVAFARDKGGFAMEFNSLPLPDETGKVFVLMSEHKGREDRQSGGSGSGGGDDRREPEATQRPAQTPVDDDPDSIPF